MQSYLEAGTGRDKTCRRFRGENSLHPVYCARWGIQSLRVLFQRDLQELHGARSSLTQNYCGSKPYSPALWPKALYLPDFPTLVATRYASGEREEKPEHPTLNNISVPQADSCLSLGFGLGLGAGCQGTWLSPSTMPASPSSWWGLGGGLLLLCKNVPGKSTPGQGPCTTTGKGFWN